MSKLNTTTRCFPRSMEEAFEDSVEAMRRREMWEWMEPHQPSNDSWQSMAYSFFAGFFVAMIVFIK